MKTLKRGSIFLLLMALASILFLTVFYGEGRIEGKETQDSKLFEKSLFLTIQEMENRSNRPVSVGNRGSYSISGRVISSRTGKGLSNVLLTLTEVSSDARVAGSAAMRAAAMSYTIGYCPTPTTSYTCGYCPTPTTSYTCGYCPTPTVSDPTCGYCPIPTVSDPTCGYCPIPTVSDPTCGYCPIPTVDDPTCGYCPIPTVSDPTCGYCPIPTVDDPTCGYCPAPTVDDPTCGYCPIPTVDTPTCGHTCTGPTCPPCSIATVDDPTCSYTCSGATCYPCPTFDDPTCGHTCIGATCFPCPTVDIPTCYPYPTIDDPTCGHTCIGATCSPTCGTTCSGATCNTTCGTTCSGATCDTTCGTTCSGATCDATCDTTCSGATCETTCDTTCSGATCGTTCDATCGPTCSGATCEATCNSTCETACSGATSGTTCDTTCNTTCSGASLPMTTTTDENGYYTFTNLPNGTYSITPGKTGYEFTPPRRTAIIIGTDTIGQDFEAVYIGAEERVLIALSEVTAAVGETIAVPVNIPDAMGVSGAYIVVTYDKDVLAVEEARITALSTGMILAVNTDTPGEVVISMASAEALTGGSGSLIDIVFAVSASAEADTVIPLSFNKAELYSELGESIPLDTQDGKITVKPGCVKGDVNGDGEIKTNDAILALRISAKAMTPTPEQKCAADVNNDGYIRPNDAIVILRMATGQAAPGEGVAASDDRHITIALTEAYGVIGESITVPVKVDSVDILAGGDICIAYDSSVLRAVDVSSHPNVLLISNLAEPGTVQIAFASVDRLISSTLAQVRFDVIADDVSPLRFRNVELYGSDALPLVPRSIDREFRSWAMTPARSDLLQNYPNPFNPDTRIPYQLREGADVTIRIYSATGEFVRELNLGHKPAGLYAGHDRAAYWDGRNGAGEQLASGVYFYTIQAGEFVATRKMILAK